MVLMNALVVDSSKYSREMMASILTSIGVHCVACASGREALALAEQTQYDFIIVSRQLDDTGAELFLLRLRKRHKIDGALTIMLTSESLEEVSSEASKAGYKHVFNKKDVSVIQDFLLEAVNSRTIDLQARILYLEDDRAVAGLTTALLTHYRAEVDHVTEVAQAIEAFKQQDYDLIITDYYLRGDETGGDLIAYVRSFGDTDRARVPILVISMEANQSKRTSFLRNGANDYILKPYDSDELIARASNLVAHKKLLQQFCQQQQELLEMAMSDQLTGLYNRRSLFDFGPKYISEARRHDHQVSLLMIDVDHFKAVNDNHGHAKGDVVLREIAEALQSSCRNEDFVARFGGEEFVMLLAHCGQADAVAKAAQLCKRVEASNPDGLLVTISIGVAELAADDDLESLFAKADSAVYKAKDLGRNRAESWTVH